MLVVARKTRFDSGKKRVTDDVDLSFLVRAADYNSLTVEELWLIYAKDRTNREVRDILIERNMPMVHKLTRKYLQCGLDYDELLSTASLWLIYAVEHFDPSRGVRFSSYGYRCVEKQLITMISTRGGRFARYMAEHLCHIRRVEREAAVSGNSKMSMAEIAKKTGLSNDFVGRALCISRPVLSYLQENENGDLCELGCSKEMDIIENVSNKELVEKAMRCLPSHYRDVLSKYYFEGKTTTQIGQEYGVSRARIHQIVEKGLSKLREFLEEKGIVTEDINV